MLSEGNYFSPHVICINNHGLATQPLQPAHDHAVKLIRLQRGEQVATSKPSKNKTSMQRRIIALFQSQCRQPLQKLFVVLVKRQIREDFFYCAIKYIIISV